MSDALKINTTLTTLDLRREQAQKTMVMIEWIGCDGLKQCCTHLVEQTQTDNNIGAEGACVLSDALKVNTTLTTLDLWSEQAQEQW